MDEDNLNLQIRKFLKKVGIRSQREIEKAIYEGLEKKIFHKNSEIDLSMVLNLKQLNITYKIEEKLKIN